MAHTIVKQTKCKRSPVCPQALTLDVLWLGVPVPLRMFTESYSQLFWLTPCITCALLSGLGRLGWRPPLEWADRLFLETYTHLGEYKPAELAGGLGRVGGRGRGGKGKDGRGVGQSGAQGGGQQLDRQVISVLLAAVYVCTGALHGLASLNVQPPVQWMSQASSVLASQTGQLGVQELTTCLWALAALRYR